MTCGLRATAVYSSALRRGFEPGTLDARLAPSGHLIENFFAKIKEFRAIATRYEKTASSYAANLHLAATIIASR